ncbi:amidohydrolase family protein [Nocardia brasiliensis]|uniref:amidohydrolase family protein n=1 Tax=Nocardia brasiliensis TaxID=37326 RepID=UPI002458DB60|nr:amidohydrolase family protein [Nocardia brasiliensis]
MHSHTVGRPSVLRGGTVLTMDSARTVLEGHDVLVVDGRIAAIGVDLVVPDGTDEIDARGGIVMPGMIDTHRHMWQTTTRGYGADWTLTQYFVWYYLNWGTKFRPEDIYAGNLLGALEALDAGVTTCVDWSHGLQTIDHADAAVDALAAVPGRFVLAYGNIQDAPANWTGTPEFRRFFDRRAGELEGFQIAFDVTGDPSFPERPAFEVARELDLAVTTHAGVWGATGDDAVRLIHEHGYAEARTVYVHASTLSADSYDRIAASGGSVSVSTESEQSAGQGYPATAALRAHGIPVSLSLDSCVLCSGDLFSAMRTTLGADRAAEHQAAHARGETVTHASLHAEQVVEWATRGGARAIGRDNEIGSVQVGKKADLVLVRNDASPAMSPLLNPHGHVVLHAQRADVDTVLVDGRIVKRDHRLVGVDLAGARRAAQATVDYLRAELGEQAWRAGMNPEIPETKVLDNPYTYTDYRSATTHGDPVPTPR